MSYLYIFFSFWECDILNVYRLDNDLYIYIFFPLHDCMFSPKIEGAAENNWLRQISGAENNLN